MKNRAVIVVVIIGVALVVAAFYFGRYQGMQTATSPNIEPETEEVMQDNVHKAMPQAEQLRNKDTHFTHFRVGQRNIKNILPDGDIMWVGTSGGVIRYDTRNDSYRLFDNTSGLLAKGVFHLSKLDDRLVVGTYGGGMSIMKGDAEGWDTYNIPHGLADAFVYDVLKARNGDIWIATWSGANRVRSGKLDDPKQWDTYTVENTKGGLPNDWVYALAQGEGDTIWMATEGGLARYVDGQWTKWGHPDGLGAKYELVQSQITFTNDPANYSKHHARQKEEMGLQQVNVAYNPNYIISLVVDKNNVVWCGTWGGGLARFDGKQWKNYTMSDGLPGNHVFMLYEDPQGQLWIGTNNGLARMDGEQFKKYDMHDGLYSNTVFSMATAHDGSYWIGSYGGVAKIQGLK
jgi:ligand-binding sensor domain-containing protein